MSNNFQQAPYLRNQREFPSDDLQQLARQCDQAYIDVAQKVNSRIIGNYSLKVFAITGERWYFAGSNSSQQSLRQIYTFTSAGSIPHNIPNASTSSISPRSYGVYTDGTNWYGIIFATSVTIAGQVTFYVTPTVGSTSGNIVVQKHATAPNISSGIIVLEFISNY